MYVYYVEKKFENYLIFIFIYFEIRLDEQLLKKHRKKFFKQPTRTFLSTFTLRLNFSIYYQIEKIAFDAISFL